MTSMRDEEETIEGQVARILTSRELVINRGADHGVEVGMYFAVYDKDPEDVKDPASGKLLGRVLRPKVKVKVTRIAERFAVAETFEEKRVNVGGVGAGFGAIADMMNPPRWETRIQTLKTEEATWEKLRESQSYVKTGDVIRQLRDPSLGTALEDPVESEDE